MLTRLEALEREVSSCEKCFLATKRNQTVFGTGDPDADIMFIGEAPGEKEDQQGLPFVGRAGQLLTKIITATYFKRDDVYICNIVKCRPPNNRNPNPKEIQACASYLARQIEIVNPKIICLLGKVAVGAILDKDDAIARLRVRVHQYNDIPVIVTYHPAALLRNGSLKYKVWEDMKLLRQHYDGKELE